MSEELSREVVMVRTKIEHCDEWRESYETKIDKLWDAIENMRDVLDKKLTLLQTTYLTEIVKRHPPWVTIVITILSSLCVGLATYAITSGAKMVPK